MAGIRSEIRNVSLPPERGQAIARLAGRQHGVIARTQLARIALDRFAIARRVRAGTLHPLHGGRVFAVGLDPLSMRGRYLAAVMAGGSGAVLSHRSAAALWELRANTTRTEITVRRGRDPIAGIRTHTSRGLPAGDVTSRDGIPVTSVARTLLDLSAVVKTPELLNAIDRSERLGLFDLTAVVDVLDRANGRKGARALRRAVAAYRTSTQKSELERRFKELVEETADIPTPSFNAVVQGEQRTHEVDAFWPDEKLAVQVDGFEFHRTRRDRERDAASDADLELAGCRVLRLTWDDVTVHAERTLRRLRIARS